MDSNKDVKMNLIVYGTPAEENGNGKCLMIEKGVFDEVDICMMSHPAPYEIPKPLWNAVDSYKVIFKGLILFLAPLTIFVRNSKFCVLNKVVKNLMF